MKDYLKEGFIKTTRYVEYLSNVILVIKKLEKLCACVDFRQLKKAIPKDEYPMMIIDILINTTTRHGVLSFMDGHSRYN